MEKETVKHILNVLRRGTITWKGRTACLNRHRVLRVCGKYKNGKNIERYFYPCEICRGYFDSPKKLEVDHIEEIGSFNGDFNTYISRMYCSPDNLQAICVACHMVKTSRFNASIHYTRKKKI